MSLANYEAPILLIEDNRIFVFQRGDSIYTFDLRTGEQLWEHAYERTLGPGLSAAICPQGSEDPGGCCRARSELWLLMAVNDGTVYFADPATGRVTALSADDGLERWSIFSPDRVPDKTIVARLIAVDGAVAVGLMNPEANPSGPERLTVWAAADGAELWSEDVASAGIASDGNHSSSAVTVSTVVLPLSVVDARRVR